MIKYLSLIQVVTSEIRIYSLTKKIIMINSILIPPDIHHYNSCGNLDIKSNCKAFASFLYDRLYTLSSPLINPLEKLRFRLHFFINFFAVNSYGTQLTCTSMYPSLFKCYSSVVAFILKRTLFTHTFHRNHISMRKECFLKRLI